MSVAILSASVSTNCDLLNTGVPQDEDMCSDRRIDEKQKENYNHTDRNEEELTC
jgi:hypothetical protein